MCRPLHELRQPAAGVEIMRHPQLVGGGAEAIFAGDDAEAKRVMIALATRMGFCGRDGVNA